MVGRRQGKFGTVSAPVPEYRGSGSNTDKIIQLRLPARMNFYSVEQVLTHAEFALLDESLGALVTHIGTVSVASGACLVAV